MTRWPVLVALVGLAAVACQPADAAEQPVPQSMAAPAAAASVEISPKAGARKVDPTKRIAVRAADGKLQAVWVFDARDRLVKGGFRTDGVWRSTRKPLDFGASYRVIAKAVNANGTPTVSQTEFRTVKPKAQLTTSISPINGQVVGVGMPVIVRLSAAVTDRAAVQEALTVEAAGVDGSWSWLTDRELHWRPKNYWPANTDVLVRVRLEGVKAGGGVWGAENRDVRYSVGSATVSTVDIKTHTMTVTQNGKVVRKIPITTGKEGFRTRNGIKVIASKERTRVMDATTIDIPENADEYYRLKVDYALRLTWSGEFVHAAPWSVADQGREDVSHGCTGMSDDNAKWFYDLSKVGDVVVYTGSQRPLEAGNGWTDWNTSWADWTGRSAV